MPTTRRASVTCYETGSTRSPSPGPERVEGGGEV